MTNTSQRSFSRKLLKEASQGSLSRKLLKEAFQGSYLGYK